MNEYINKLSEVIRYKGVVCSTNGKKRCVEYLNIACGFDIETSSFMLNDEKMATMYTWQMKIEDVYITGRTWEDFINCLDALEYLLELHRYKKLTIYVHNLAYEFGFMRKHLNITSQFFISERTPIYIEHNETIIFKCSYQLSNLSLANIGEQIGYHKALGDLDYNLIRHSKTPLTEKEKEYNFRDVEILVLYIRSMIKEYKYINKIPLTSTGTVRLWCKEHLRENGKIVYSSLIRNCTPTEEQYIQLHKTFQGGYVHANYMFCDLLLENVHSYDFTSSYPYVLLTEKFPKKFKKLTIKKLEIFYKFIEEYACMFTITLKNIKSRTSHHILSISKCITDGECKTDNGRIIEAEILQTNLTDVDFGYLQKFYTWDKNEIYIKNFYYAKKERLPKEFLMCILEFYEQKTKLKGVKDMEDIYLKYKGMLNSLYGMAVTNPCKGLIRYNPDSDDYETEKVDITKRMNRLRYDIKNNFLLYQWGVWCTAYARKNLMDGILKVGEDVVYCDTDSIKFLFLDEHKSYFDNYNKNVIIKLKEVADYLEVDMNRFSPVDIKGVTHTIGLWDYEGCYKYFKTLGAKRYMVTKKNDEYEITVAGLPKTAVHYIKQQKKPYKFFTHDMVIPAGYMDIKDYLKDKLCMSYIDEPTSGVVTDYLGNTSEFFELSSIHSERVGFKLNITQDFFELLTGRIFDDRTGRALYETPDERVRYNLWE